MSKEVWKNIELWRPRSCYLYIARKCLECPNYRPWNDFDWGDYLQRERIMKAFCVRHLPVLRGEVLIPTKYLKDPESWDDVKPDSDKKGRTSDVKTPPKKKSSAISLQTREEKTNVGLRKGSMGSQRNGNPIPWCVRHYSCFQKICVEEIEKEKT